MSFKEFNQQNKARAKADKEYTKSVDDLIKKNKRLKTKFEEQVTSSKDLNKELMSQLDTTDKIDKAVNRVLGVERLQVAVLENAKALSKNITDEERDKLLLDQKSLMAQGQMSNAIQEQLSGIIGLVKGARAFVVALLANPLLAMVAIVIALAKAFLDVQKAVTETTKELGVSRSEAAKILVINKALGLQAKLYGLELEDVKDAQAAIRENLGGSVDESIALSMNFAKLSASTGQTAAQLSTTLSIMESVSGESRDALTAQMETTRAMIEMEGLAPGDIFKDVADNAENFASFAKAGSSNVFQAAIAAKKLGLNMAAVSSTTESLLDFESSIEKQMEASMLLGREINLDKARQLAVTGDQKGMLDEVLKAVGGEAEFNEMNVIQRRALADAVGQSVEGLSRLVKNNKEAEKATTSRDTGAASDNQLAALNNIAANTADNVVATRTNGGFFSKFRKEVSDGK
jgi:hypothetical protein